MTYQIIDDESYDVNTTPGAVEHSIGLVTTENTENGGGANNSGATGGLDGSEVAEDSLAETGISIVAAASGAVAVLIAGLIVMRGSKLDILKRFFPKT